MRPERLRRQQDEKGTGRRKRSPGPLFPCEGCDGGLADVISSGESVRADVRPKIKLVPDVVKIFSLSEAHSVKMYQNVQ